MPRAGLTRQRVVEEAAAVADQVGWDRLSLAAVAERVGVRQPSLYKHIDSLDGLRGEVSTLGVRQLAEVLAKAVLGRSGSRALLALADAYRGFATDFPGRYAATLRAPRADAPEHAAAAEEVLRVVTATLEGYDIGGDDAVHATRALRATLHGFVSLEAAGGFGMPVDADESFRRLVAGLDAMLRAGATSSRRSDVPTGRRTRTRRPPGSRG